MYCSVHNNFSQNLFSQQRLISYFIIFICSLFAPANSHAEWQTEDAAIMGTTIHVEVWHMDADIRQQGIDAVLQEMERVNRLMSPYIENSQLSKINQFAHEGPVEVDKDLFNLLEKSIQVSELTNGAFDITYASVGSLYNYRKKLKPTEQDFSTAKEFIDYKNVLLDKDQFSVSYAKQGVKIDLGGIAKGFAVDQSIMHLEKLDIKHALVSAGGDTRIIGDRLGRPWLVGIRDPQNIKEVIAMLPLQNEALSTSGDYERFFVEGDVKYHHIIHPSTGRSAKEVRSVSIVTSDSTTADALSTSVFVLGAKKGLALLNSLDGVEGVIVDQAGNLFYSTGLEQPNNN